MSDTPRGIPRRDGSGGGNRGNRGRGGCDPPEDRGWGRNIPRRGGRNRR